MSKAELIAALGDWDDDEDISEYQLSNIFRDHAYAQENY